MTLTELSLEPDVFVALEVEELALRLLPWIAHLPPSNRQLGVAINGVRDHYGGPASSKLETALREAWAWLEGSALLIEHPGYASPNQLRILSRRASQLVNAKSPTLPRAGALPKASLHPAIRDDVWPLFHRGKFDTAVFEAFKAVEVAVRRAAKATDKDLGVPLVRKAFDKNTGPLADMSADEGEREARAHLFAGAIGSYKNPHSHRKVALERPEEAEEILMLANHLLRIIDSCEGAVQ